MSFILQNHKEVAQITSYQDVSLGIMRWGTSNAYPQTLVNFIAQSANAYPVVSRTSDFLKGAGFEGEDVVVGPNELTAKDVVSIMADDYALFRAFSIHGNYNLDGKITQITPMRIPTLRFNEFDELNFASKLGYHPNFGLNANEKRMIERRANRDNIKWFDRFNPGNVQKQIQNSKGGLIANYNGQILYHSDAGHSSYPVSPLQAPINYLLSDIENSILVRKETSTGFVGTYLFKTTMSAESPILAKIEEEIYNSQGARGSGRVITLSDLSPEEVSSNVLEEIGSGGAGSKATIEASILTHDLDREVLSGAYKIPPILAGFGISNGLSGQDLEDAYNVFNALTAGSRSRIEQGFNKMLAVSEFKNLIPPIKIKPLSLDVVKEEGVVENDSKEGDIEAINRNPLTGRQEQALQRIVRNVGKGKITRAQAEDQMRSDLGFSEDRINTWLGEKQE